MPRLPKRWKRPEWSYSDEECRSPLRPALISAQTCLWNGSGFHAWALNHWATAFPRAHAARWIGAFIPPPRRWAAARAIARSYRPRRPACPAAASSRERIPEELRDAPYIAKPVDAKKLVEYIRKVIPDTP
jgi:hypothetical protein